MNSPSKLRNYNKENTFDSPVKKNSQKDDSFKALQMNICNSTKNQSNREPQRKDVLGDSFLQNLQPMKDINTSFDEEVP